MTTHLLKPSMDQLLGAHIDVTDPGLPVEIITDARGVVWINVGPVCLLRICRTEAISIETPQGVVYEKTQPETKNGR